MSAKIVTVCNQKGGPGKTTLTIQLAGTIARRGHKVLVVEWSIGLCDSHGYDLPAAQPAAAQDWSGYNPMNTTSSYPTYVTPSYPTYTAPFYSDNSYSPSSYSGGYTSSDSDSGEGTFGGIVVALFLLAAVGGAVFVLWNWLLSFGLSAWILGCVLSVGLLTIFVGRAVYRFRHPVLTDSSEPSDAAE